MLKTRAFTAILIILIFGHPRQVLAQSPHVIINEVAWTGTKGSSTDEWIELYNSTDSEILLTGWGIYEGGGTVLIEGLEGTIPSYGYFIIERTDETTLPGITASQTPSSWSGSGLSNSGEHLVLKDATDVVDEVNASASWFAGGGENFASMQRIDSDLSGSDPDNWQATVTAHPEQKDVLDNPIYGTPLEANVIEEEAVGGPTTEPEDSVETHYDLELNEILPNPTGSDDQEFVELYNPSEHDIPLTGWKIRDGSATKELDDLTLESHLVPAHSYLAIYRHQGLVSLNNSGETITLIDPDGNEQEVTYPEMDENVSYAQNDGDWKETIEPTPEAENIIREPEESNSEENGDENETDNTTDEIQILTISELKEKETGILVQLTGTVTSEPGIFGNDWYIADETGGLRILGVPDSELTRGNKVTLTGISKLSRGEWYLKFTTLEESTASNILQPEIQTIGTLDKSMVGKLIKITATVKDVSGETIHLEDENGTLRVLLPEDRTTALHKGDEVELVGILSQWGVTKDGEPYYRLRVRDDQDIVVKTAASANKAPAKAKKTKEASAAEASGSAEGKRLPGGVIFIIPAALLLVSGLMLVRTKYKNRQV